MGAILVEITYHCRLVGVRAICLMQVITAARKEGVVEDSQIVLYPSDKKKATWLQP